MAASVALENEACTTNEISTETTDDRSESSTSRKKTKEERKEEFRPPPLREPQYTWRKVLKDVWISEDEKALKHELCQSILDEIFEKSQNVLETVLILHKVI
ncbi:unnamed protein product [Gongylonema pulchrum]|uniref:Uncharacterized protein n=1 Tax=Gongylonema pulchrum TaxID=637853 RepID=A0A183D088_9BILA|nr:unnamed protein product [Gongylonema pulchrum]